MSWVEKLSLMVTSVGFYNCCRFIWTYRRRSGGNWKVSPHGRYMMFTTLVLGSLFLLIISRHLFPSWYGSVGRATLALVLYVCYVAFTGWLNMILDISLPEKPEANLQEGYDESTVDLRS